MLSRLSPCHAFLSFPWANPILFLVFKGLTQDEATKASRRHLEGISKASRRHSVTTLQAWQGFFPCLLVTLVNKTKAITLCGCLPFYWLMEYKNILISCIFFFFAFLYCLQPYTSSICWADWLMANLFSGIALHQDSQLFRKSSAS